MVDNRQEDLAFVLMPFVEELDPVHSTIVMAVNQAGAGLRCIRADEDTRNNEIFKGIVNLIAGSRLIIADLSFANANVLYELGTAHAFRKPTILLLQKGMEAPFDVKPYRYIEYTSTRDGLENLQLKLREQIREILGADKSVTISNPVTDGLSDANLRSLYPDNWPALVAYLLKNSPLWQKFTAAILVMIIGGAGGVGVYSIFSSLTTQTKSEGIMTEDVDKLQIALKEKETSLAESQKHNKNLLSENARLKEELKKAESLKQPGSTEEIAELKNLLKKREADFAQLQKVNEELQARNTELGLKLKKEGLARSGLEKDLAQLQQALKARQLPEDKGATPSQIQRAYQELVSLRKTVGQKAPGYAANPEEVTAFNQYLLFTQRISKVEEIKKMRTLEDVSSNRSLLAAIDGLLVAVRLNYNLD